MPSRFELEADERATAWLAANPVTTTQVIAYDVRRCCGGGKICQVTVRALASRDMTHDHVRAKLAGGTDVLIDPRAAKRLPARIGLTVRGFGRFKHLDLELTGPQWGDLLYS